MRNNRVSSIFANKSSYKDLQFQRFNNAVYFV